MGGKPYCFNLSLGLPKKINKKWLTIFSKNILKLQKKYNFFLLGGDIAQTNNIIISATFFGKVSKGKIIKRNGAKINDDIWITGNLGNSFAGLMFKKNILKANNSIKKFFIEKYLYPSPCMIGSRLRSLANSAIDISDGFFQDLKHILTNSNLSSEIFVNNVPVSVYLNLYLKKAKKNKLDFVSNGDDYQILFTANKNKRMAQDHTMNSHLHPNYLTICICY